jgi:hypothetical protein
LRPLPETWSDPQEAELREPLRTGDDLERLVAIGAATVTGVDGEEASAFLAQSKGHTGLLVSVSTRRHFGARCCRALTLSAIRLQVKDAVKSDRPLTAKPESAVRFFLTTADRRKRGCPPRAREDALW